MSSPFRIHLSEPIDPLAMEELARHATLDVATAFTPVAELHQRVRDVQVIVNNSDTVLVDKAMIDAAPGLRQIVRHGSGYNNVDVEYATHKGVVVCNAAGGNAITMAELTLCLMVAAARRVLPSIDAARKGNPDRTQFKGLELYGKTLGIIGMGYIGREVAARAKAFGMRVQGLYRTTPSPEAAAFVPGVDFDTLIATSDVITLHVPATAQTKNMIAAPQMARMRPGAILVNMARGGIVNEADLAAALHSGSLFAAAVDVVEHEPVQAENPLLKAPNMTLLPHIGGQTPEAFASISRLVAEEILRLHRGERPQRVVNPAVLAKLEL